jgi:UDP-galactopyranose mutase
VSLFTTLSFKRRVFMNTDDKKPNFARELELIKELHKKGSTHTEIAKCIQRERKIFKAEPTDIGNCLIEVEKTILNLFRWRGTKDELTKAD